MNAQLQKYRQTTLEDFLNVISSQESGAGVMPLDLQTGKMINKSGQQACHVNHSAQQGNSKEKQTKDTYCHTFLNSLESANLTESLVNRLKMRLGTDGSMIYKQQWKQKTTPSGIVYWAHTASARFTKGKDCIGLHKTNWATPCTIEPDEQPEAKWARHKMINERQKAKGKSGLGTALHLGAQVHLTTSYPTPAARDYKDTGDLSKSQFRKDGKERNDTLPRVAVGVIQDGLNVEMENIGQLNPALSRWLMSYPKEWCIAAILAHRQILTKRKKRV